MKKRIDERFAGCWYDSHRGFTDIALNIVQDALKMGYRYGKTWSKRELHALSSPELWDEWEQEHPDTELLIWAAEEAETYLQSLAPDRYWIGWNDGDFGMWETDDEEDNDSDD